MKLAFIILAHQDLHRTAELAQYLASNGCPIGLHIDAKASPKEFEKLKSDLASSEMIHFASREKCEWGQFSIVQATLNAAEELLKHHDDLTHVFLLSGSCLPARPIKQLKAFLARHINVDFIESVSPKDEKWVKDGLDAERFSLFFPFSWRKHRFLFDRTVDLQRMLRIGRRIPKNIRPHMGSQWWCLTASTLRSIVEDPKRKKNDAYFRKTWIPDESYFQTLARNHTDHIRPQSLTFASFDTQGKPFLFYDDHLNLLPKTDAFFIRKVWSGADKMYRSLLRKNRKHYPISDSDSLAFRTVFEDAKKMRKNGNEGRMLQGRFPADHVEMSPVSNRDYGVLSGLGYLFQDLDNWIERTEKSYELNIYGNIFARGGFDFKDGKKLTKGNLSANSRLRNYNPKGFLSNFIAAADTSSPIAFLFDVVDVQTITASIATDERAQFVIVREAWMLKLAQSDESFKSKLRKAKAYQRRENSLLQAFENDRSARFTIFTLNEALKAPGLVLQTALKTINPASSAKPIELPVVSDASKLDSLARKLKKNDIELIYLPARKKKKIVETKPETKDHVERPYVVK